MILSLMLVAAEPAQDARAPLLIDRDRIDRPRAAPPIPAPATVPTPGTRVSAGASDTVLTGIRFRGTKAPSRVAAAARAFIGRRADTATLQALATALSDAYGKSDVALYTVAIPQQDFRGGVVAVLLTEATIFTANVVSAPGRHARLRERMTPLLREKPLSRSTFERQMTLMRSLPGMTIDPVFTDPQGTGQLALTVTPTQRRSKLSGGFSNRGVDLLGDGQFDARAEFYGAARDGDQVSLAGSAASDLKRYRYVSAGYAAPVAARGTTLSATGAYLETRPRGSQATGRARLAGLTLSDPVLRNFHQSADVSVGLDGINSDNALFGNVIASERTRAVRLAGGFSDTRTRRSIAVSASLSQGLDILGARATAPFAETGFAKATVVRARAGDRRARCAARQRVGPIFARRAARGGAFRDRWRGRGPRVRHRAVDRGPRRGRPGRTRVATLERRAVLEQRTVRLRRRRARRRDHAGGRTRLQLRSRLGRRRRTAPAARSRRNRPGGGAGDRRSLRRLCRRLALLDRLAAVALER